MDNRTEHFLTEIKLQSLEQLFTEEALTEQQGAAGFTDGNLIFEIYDEEHNQLFASSDYKNTPYWDFEFGSTVDCTVEAKLNLTEVKSGCAAMVIGFKQ